MHCPPHDVALVRVHSATTAVKPADPMEKRTSGGGSLLSLSTAPAHTPTATMGVANIAARLARRSIMVLIHRCR